MTMMNYFGMSNIEPKYIRQTEEQMQRKTLPLLLFDG